MKKLILIGMAIAIGFYGVYSYFIEDIQINKYSNMEVVREHEAIEKGWIPKILPMSAYKIIETHDLDTNTLLGAFNYREQDEVIFMRNLTPLDDSNDTMFWDNFLFKVDKSKNHVKFRNRTP